MNVVENDFMNLHQQHLLRQTTEKERQRPDLEIQFLKYGRASSLGDDRLYSTFDLNVITQ